MSSNDKNVQSTETKKERVSVLEAIRRRTGLLVGIVGLALVIFILEALLGNVRSIFGGNDASSLGSISGKNIDRNDFLIKVENQLNLIRQQKQSNDIDDQTRSQVVNFIWQQYINDLVIKPQYDKIGITVSEDEIYQRVVANPDQTVVQRLVDQKTGKVYDQLANPMGGLDPAKWKQFVQNAGPNEEAYVKQMEEDVKNTRFAQKYGALIRKGIYVTSAEAKQSYIAQNNKMNITYAVKLYSSVSDSAAKVTDSDIQKYYNDHSYEFKNNETSRKIEYVAFNVVPSDSDMVAIERDAQRAAKGFTAKTIKEDSTYIMQESEGGNVAIQDFTKKTMIVRDSSIFMAAPGTVFGPYNEGAYYKIYKLESVESVADSAKVRHILIGLMDPATQQPKRSKEQAKKQADSLMALIKDKKIGFDTLVKTISDDMGSKTNGGDYGWFDENKGFVQPFKDAGLMGTKGNISVVETQFGYHIIEVLDVSKGRHFSYKVAQIFKAIAPSEETNKKTFAKANEFGGKNNTAELFDKAADAEKLTKRIADNVKESDRQLPGLDNAKDLVRWVYSANKGEIAVFSFPDKHIVAKIAGIKNRGVLPLEEVKEEVTQKAIQAKKADMFIQEFKTKGGAGSADAIASKLGLETKKAEKLAGNSHNVEGLGHDDVFVGTALGTKSGQTCKPTAGDNGVFVLTVNSVEEGKLPADFKNEKKMLEQMLGGRADYEVFNVLKDLAEIEDHTGRIE